MRILPSLAALALTDSLSFGTLDVPIVMLVQRRIRRITVVAYLVSIALFYWAVGVLLVLGARGLVDDVARLSEKPAFAWTEAALGVGLLIAAVWTGRSWLARRAQPTERSSDPRPPSLMARWQARLLGEDASIPVSAAIAVGIGLLEVATMVPFLAAMTLMMGEHWSPGRVVATVGVYAAVMVAPSFIMLAMRVVAGERIEPRLESLHRFIKAYATQVITVILALVGLALVWDGMRRLAHWG